MLMPELLAVPEWTEIRQKSGLDPLGLQAASVRLYQALLPGISNVTLRARYYGLYAWLSHAYAKARHDADREIWKRTVRRSEALYALTAARANQQDEAGETGVAGILWAQRLFSEHKSGAIEFSAFADPGGDGVPYLKQAWGAFGAAYESQLRETGVLGAAEEHDVPVPTEEIGDQLAETFDHAAGEIGTKFQRIVQSGRVSLSALDDLASLLPSKIGAQSRERGAYERILFAETAAANDRDRSRRKSLILPLRLAQHLGRDISPQDVRWILYAGQDWESSPFEIDDPSLSLQRKRWWAYQAGDLGHLALEALLKWMLDELEGHPSGLTSNQLVEAAIESMEIQHTGWPRAWRELVAELPKAENPLSESEPTSEWSLYGEILQAGTKEQRAPVRSAQAAVEMMAVLCRQIAPDRKFFAQQHGGDHVDAPARSFATELAFLDGLNGVTIQDMLVALLKKRILQRHLWVAMRKLQYQRDYTFLVETHDGRLHLRAKDGPVETNPRLGPALTFLRDIHLMNEDGLTKRGERLAGLS